MICPISIAAPGVTANCYLGDCPFFNGKNEGRFKCELAAVIAYYAPSKVVKRD